MCLIVLYFRTSGVCLIADMQNELQLHMVAVGLGMDINVKKQSVLFVMIRHQCVLTTEGATVLEVQYTHSSALMQSLIQMSHMMTK